jgi:hypothetical protein
MIYCRCEESLASLACVTQLNSSCMHYNREKSSHLHIQQITVALAHSKNTHTRSLGSGRWEIICVKLGTFSLVPSTLAPANFAKYSFLSVRELPKWACNAQIYKLGEHLMDRFIWSAWLQNVQEFITIEEYSLFCIMFDWPGENNGFSQVCNLLDLYVERGA